jgi:acyl-CoA reductase-like NAD-dependent aldehyde dehydrogenase
VTTEEIQADAERLLKRDAKRLPKMTAEKRRRIVSVVAANLEANARDVRRIIRDRAR